MKKFILVLSCLGLILVFGFFYHKYSNKDAISLSHFVPEDTLVYVQQKELGTLLDDFSRKPLAKAIQSIDFIKLALDLDVSYYTVEKFRKVLEFTDSKNFSLLFDELFSQNFTIALLAGEKTENYEEYLKNNLLILCTPKHGNRLIESMLPLFDKELHLSSANYGKYVIKRVIVNDQLMISLVNIGSKFLVGFNQRTIRHCLDRYDDRKANLAENYFFRELQNKYKTAHLFSFFALQKLYTQLETYLKEQPEIDKSVLEQLRNWRGFTAGAYGSWRKNDTSRNLLSLHFNTLKIPKNSSKILNIKPQVNQIISFVPNDTLFYYWTNTFDLPTLWSIYENESAMHHADIEDLKNTIFSITDMKLEELVGLTGNSFHIIARKPSPVDLVPVPNFSLIVDLKNKKKAERVLNTFFFKNDIPHGRDIYKGVYFTYWGDVLQRGLQPVYAFYDHWLILSSSVKMHISIIDSLSKKNGIITSDVFSKIGKPLLLENNSMTIVQYTDLLKILKELVRWTGTMMAIQNQETARKSKILIDHFVLPLLDGMKMYPHIVTRSYSKAGVLTFESNTIITN